MLVLVGDIGGTQSRLLLAKVKGSDWELVTEQTYLSAEYQDLIQVIKTFLEQNNIISPIDAACFAVAGPVISGSASITNLPWLVNEKKLSDMLHTPRVKLINDFIAVAYGISELQDKDVLILQQGISEQKKNLPTDAVVIGAGTGLGVAHLAWLNDHYDAFSSEVGHAGFAPANKQQTELLTWLQKDHSHVSLEMVLSGRGLVNIYCFLHQVCGITESPKIKQAMLESEPAQVISEAALAGKDELCQKTLDCFVDIYGSAAGNAALNYYPVSHVYIAGGIAAKIKDQIISRRFIDAFINKGLMSANMEKITIKLITEEKVGLYGALTNIRTLSFS
jgi:glucokinase